MNEPTNITVTCGPDKVKETDAYVDDNDFIVELPPLSTLKHLSIVNLFFIKSSSPVQVITVCVSLIHDIESILGDLPIPTKVKNMIGDILLKDTSIQEKRIAVRKLARIGLNQKYVNLFLKLLEYMAEV